MVSKNEPEKIKKWSVIDAQCRSLRYPSVRSKQKSLRENDEKIMQAVDKISFSF